MLQPSCPWPSMSLPASHSPFYCFDPKPGFYDRTPRVACLANSSYCPAQFKEYCLDNKKTSSHKIIPCANYTNLYK